MKDYSQYVRAKLEEHLIEEINKRNIQLKKTRLEEFVVEANWYNRRRKKGVATKIVWEAAEIFLEQKLYRALAAFILNYSGDKYRHETFRKKVMTSRNREAIDMLLNNNSTNFSRATKDADYPDYRITKYYKNSWAGEKVDVKDLNWVFQAGKFDFSQNDDRDYLWKRIEKMDNNSYEKIDQKLIAELIEFSSKENLSSIVADDVWLNLMQKLKLEVDLKLASDRKWFRKLLKQHPSRLYWVVDEIKNWDDWEKPFVWQSSWGVDNLLLNYLEPCKEGWSCVFASYDGVLWEILNNK